MKSETQQKVILAILDGWGHGLDPKVSAIAQAKTPFIDSLYNKYPNSELITFGEEVGLPDGQMGNSEVGHLNIGAGRVVYQELARINKAIREKTLHQNSTLVEALQYAKAHQKNVHLLGLVSDGGVHSHLNHLMAMCDITEEQGVQNTYIHAFMDGRDTSPTGGKDYLTTLQGHIEGKNVQIASVIGRYYAMDRDKRWERIKLAYNLMVKGTGTPTQNPIENLKQSYQDGVTDEFIMPLVCTNDNQEPLTTIQKDDVVICFNFRTDRCREITQALSQQDFPEQDMSILPLKYVTMTRYDESFKGVDVLFHKDDIKNTLGEVIAKEGLTQLRISETEKYPHVTFFFSGGREAIFEGESRKIIPSPKVATYDLQPEMSAVQLTDTVIQDITDNQPDFICLNYPNADMVGHTGVFSAAIQAAQAVDTCAERLITHALQHGYEAIIIADHGNSDYLINEDGSPHTAHTKNLVPCFYVSNTIGNRTLQNGKLADVAPTILKLMNLEIPKDMDGKVLIEE